MLSIALLLVSISCFSYVCYAYSTPEESLSPSTAMNELPDETDEKFELAFESPAFTQEDFDNNFQSYADVTSTIYASTEKNAAFSNVVGVVLDDRDETPIPNATISVNGITVSTDAEGRFNIFNLPCGNYDWQISADGFGTSTYLGYPVDDLVNANIYQFYLFVNRDFTKTRQVMSGCGVGVDLDIDQLSNDSPDGIIARGNPILNSPPTVSAEVKVWDRDRDKNLTINRVRYIAQVVASEMYCKSDLLSFGLEDLQADQVLWMQAIASNTFLEYAQSCYSTHTINDVCNTSHCQTYDTTYNSDYVLQLVQKGIFIKNDGDPRTVIAMYKPSNNKYQYIYGAYFRYCKNNGTETYTKADEPALKAVSCTDLFNPGGKQGNLFGVCQHGALYLAKNDYRAGDIIRYYYSNTQTEYCPIPYLLEK